MARKRVDEFVLHDDEDVPDPVHLGGGTATAVLDAPPALAQAEPPPALRWRVSLDCPTPIKHRTLVLLAPDAVTAKAMFCAANNIGGSAHDWHITPLDGEEMVPASEVLKQDGPAIPKPMPGWVVLRTDPCPPDSIPTGVLLAFALPYGVKLPLRAGDRFAVPRDCAHAVGEYLLARVADLAAAI